MKSLELKQKLDSAQVAVDKRLGTIAKLESKLTKEDIEVAKKALTMGYKERGQFLSKYSESKLYSYEQDSQIEQLHDNYKKLEEVETIRNNWQLKYDTQLNKENAPKIKVLWDFLGNWGARVSEWYNKNSEHYLNMINEYKELERKFYAENSYDQVNSITKNSANTHFNNFLRKEYGIPEQIYDAKDYAKLIQGISQLTIDLTEVKFKQDQKNYPYSVFNNVCFAYGEYEIVKFDNDKLNKFIEQEKLRKYEDLCNRITDVVGEITNINNLSIGNQQGELNGLVEGTKGKCFVETISAGGYNIQCFHYRVLVKKVK